MPEGPIATVDLAAIDHNLGRLRTHLPESTGVLAAVKANAYGHGAGPVARRLTAGGVGWLGVATPAEALELRALGIDADILIFSPVYERLAELVDADVAVTIAGQASLEALMRADLPARARAHVKVDTGMGRLGVPPREALQLVQAVESSAAAVLEGLWTHFARADEPHAPSNREQLARFTELLTELERQGIQPELVHAANSAATVSLPGAAFDLVRPGIALYGYHAGLELNDYETELIPAMTLSAPVTFVKDVAAGTSLSYGHTWTATEDTRVATVRCGYADGYPRSLSNRAHVRVHEEQVRVVGRVCMDQLLIDVGNLEVQIGDMVDLFGPSGPTAADLALRIGTISYELLTSVGSRVERRYLNA